MKIGYKSDVGRKRELDEDSIVIIRSDAVYESRKIQAALLVLADGMGGHNAGEIASYFAAKRVAEEVIQLMLKKNLAGASEKKITTLLRDTIKKVNTELFSYAKKNSQYEGMGTTITTALILGNYVYIGHVGDSRAYILNRREVRQLTKDHSLVQNMIEEGKISDEEARTHPQKNIITRTVGMRESVDVDAFKIRIHQGEYLLVCCDGLTDMLSDEEVHTTVITKNDPQTICNLLVKKANEQGGLDNISVIVVKNEGSTEDKTEIRYFDRG